MVGSCWDDERDLKNLRIGSCISSSSCCCDGGGGGGSSCSSSKRGRKMCLGEREMKGFGGVEDDN